MAAIPTLQMPGDRTGSARSWWVIARALSTGSRRRSFGSESALSSRPCARQRSIWRGCARPTASSGKPGPHTMVRLIARVVGIGVETADMLVHEILSRNLRDRQALARYAGLTGSPDESGSRRREKGLSRSGNARVRRGMIRDNDYMLLARADRGSAFKHAQDHDRCTRAKAVDRPVAFSDDRSDPRRSLAATGDLKIAVSSMRV